MRMDSKDRIIRLLVVLVMMQFVVCSIFVAWFYQEVKEIKETAEFAEGLALDSYNSKSMRKITI